MLFCFSDFVTNPRHEFLYPPHQSAVTSVSCTNQEYRTFPDSKQDSISTSSLSKRNILTDESASSSSPLTIGASSPSTSFNATVPLSSSLLRQPVSTAATGGSNSRLSAIHQSAIINVPQQFPDSQTFTGSFYYTKYATLSPNLDPEKSSLGTLRGYFFCGLLPHGTFFRETFLRRLFLSTFL